MGWLNLSKFLELVTYAFNSTLFTQIADSHASIPVQVGTGFDLQILVLNFQYLQV